MRIRPVAPEDNAAILGLLESTPQRGAITLNFERRPDYFRGAGICCEHPEIWVAEKDGAGPAPASLAAVYNIGWRRVWVNGERRPIRYAHDLRIAPAYQGSRLLFRLFGELKKTLAPEEWMQTVILRDNEASRKTIASGRAGLPHYYPCGTIETSLIYTRRRPPQPADGTSIRPLGMADRAEAERFLWQQGRKKQFFPFIELTRVGRSDYYRGLKLSDWLGVWYKGRLRGLVGTWDQHDIKQTRVLGYRRGLSWVRSIHNATRLLHGGLYLPAPGECLSFLTLHTLVFEDNEPYWLQLLMDHMVYDRRNQYSALVCGLFQQDPLHEALKGFRRRSLLSDHYLVGYGKDPRPTLDPDHIPYAEVARL